MIDLQVLQKFNAVLIAMLVQGHLEKIKETLGNVAVLCSDSASYMKNLHTNLRVSNPELKALHIRAPSLPRESGLKADSFKTSPTWSIFHVIS